MKPVDAVNRRRDPMAAERPWVAELLDGAEFLAADVGARGDLPRHWLVLDGIAKFVAFDADPAACEALERVYAARGHGHLYRTVSVALAGANSSRTFYMTAARSGSSFFNPESPMVLAYTNSDYLYPIETTKLETRDSQQVLNEIGISRLELIKLDIQGCELEVLQALRGGVLDTVLGIETEAAMQPKGIDHPTFRDIDRFMDENGFELFDLWPVRLHRALNGSRHANLSGLFGVAGDSPTVARRIWEVDAIYFRRPECVIESGDASAVRRLAVCYCVYGYFAEAHSLLESAATAKVLTSKQAALAGANVRRWHRECRYSWYYGIGSSARLVRKLAAWVRQAARRLAFGA